MEKEIQMVTDYLDKIAIKLGIGVEQIWPWFVKQVYIDAIVSSALMLTVVPITLWCCIFTAKHWNPRGEAVYSIYDKNHEPIWVTILTILTLLSFGVIAGFLILFPNIFNADYWAFKSLMSSIREMRW